MNISKIVIGIILIILAIWLFMILPEPIVKYIVGIILLVVGLYLLIVGMKKRETNDEDTPPEPMTPPASDQQI